MNALTFGSLFAGIGGLDLGLERAGMKCLWQVEIDPYAQRILAKHWPDVPRFADVREVGARNLAPVDLICGGFPCQDISLAGKGEGIAEGTRSGLWFEYRRIIREIRPRFVLVENVAALRSRGLDLVLADLAESGYDAEWDCVPAAAIGAPHRRDRIFVVAHRNGSRLQERGEPDGHAIQPRVEASQRDDAGRRGANVADADDARLAFGTVLGTDAQEELAAAFRDSREGSGQWAAEPGVGRVADGVPSRVDRLKCLGNAVVPQVAEFIGRRILSAREAA